MLLVLIRILYRFLKSAMATVKVGEKEDKKPFNINRALIGQLSKACKQMLQGDNFKESEEGVVNLADDGVMEFACFAGWLYTQSGMDTLPIMN